MDLSIGLTIGQSAPNFAGDFKSFLPGWGFLIQSDRGVSATGGVVDSWTDQIGGLVGTAPTGTQKPIVIAGPNGKPAIQSVNGQNTSVAFAYAMTALTGTPSHVYAVFRQDAWTLNCALFGSPGAEFSIRLLQFAASPQISQAQVSPVVGGPAIGAYGRLSTLFSGSGSDYTRYGGATSPVANAGAIPNSSLTIFNQLNSLPIQASLCMFGVRTVALTASELAALDAAVASYYGPSVAL